MTDSVGQWWNSSLERIDAGDDDAARVVAQRASQVLRPTGAFARLDEVAVHLARWQRRVDPVVERPAALVFAADHGVAASGEVSAYPVEVTAAMMRAFAQERSTLHALARRVGAEVHVVDVGVGRPTGDLRHETALSPQRWAEAVIAGRDAVADLDADLVVIGEMGIGNTTPAAAICAALDPDQRVEDWVGRGTGVDDDGLARKRAAVSHGLTRCGQLSDPVTIMRELGGAELAAMAAAILAARERSLPVLLDGFVVSAAAAVLHAVRPDSLAHCLAGHVSAEAGHRRLLVRLGLEPLLDLGLRLGEASGAMAAVPLVAMAAAAVVEVPTFAEWFGG